VLGVDDWCQRRGRTYGTLLVDLERHHPLALLPDRTADTLAAWLTEHPGIEVISRDRAPAYAEGATRGAPAAVQVADRFHVVQNLGDALVQVLTPHRAAMQQAAGRPAAAPTSESGPPSTPARVAPTRVIRSLRADSSRRACRLARYDRVVALRTQGWTHATIARDVGISQRTVVRWLAAETFPERRPRRRPPNPYAPYADYLTQRWGDGCHNATQLWREICEQGYHGPRYRIWEVMHRLRAGDTAVTDVSDEPSPPSTATRLTPRGMASIILRRPEERSTAQQETLTMVRAAVAEVDHACALGERFLTIVRERNAGDLVAWLDEAVACGFTDLERFATGLARDGAAVRATLTLPYSNGQTEGQITRLKLIKRSMYGRAKLDLLERRVLYRAAA
jgi:transposase